MALRLDSAPFRSSYFFLVTTVLATLGWFLAIIFQGIATAQFGHASVRPLWFAILLQAALNIGFICTVGTSSTETNRFQMTAFASIATVFAVFGVDTGVFSEEPVLVTMGAGYLVLATVDILWIMYFTAEEDSLTLHVLNHLGNTPPAAAARSRRKITTRPSSSAFSQVHVTTPKPNYALGGGVGSDNMTHEPKRRGSVAASLARSVVSAAAGAGAATLKRSGTGRSGTSRKSLVGSIAPSGDDEQSSVPEVPATPLALRMPVGARMMPGVIVGTPPPPMPIPSIVTMGPQVIARDAASEMSEVLLRAQALHAYKGSPVDPNELSFAKGEILEIEDQEGKWWQARKADGTFGIVPSNYVTVLPV
ncbi:hypothetical protein C8R46DRAFT_990971 [Mycena filopes]|nr:hypothetical protein C8R46DRAFT_990971 [Mycena filopes]